MYHGTISMQSAQKESAITSRISFESESREATSMRFRTALSGGPQASSPVFES